MHLRLFLGVLALVLVAVAPLPIHAASKTITASHTYVMGDSDSKEQARALCYLTAKRKVLDEAGVFIESSAEITNFKLTKDQINSYSAAILSVKVVKEGFGFANGVNTLTLTVKADVDMTAVKKRLAEVVANKELQTKVDAQQQQIRKMERQIQALNEKLGVVPAASNDQIRNERNTDLVAYYRLGAERGEAAAQFNLALLYFRGEKVQADVPRAIEWLRKSANQGYAEAQLHLGIAYSEGKGVLPDHAQAVTWYRKAAEQGDAMAQLVLGGAYYDGIGVPQDYTQFLYWYRKAAEQGYAAAQTALGLTYAEGKGVPQDYVEAYKWVTLGAMTGDRWAVEKRDEVAQKLSPSQLAKGQRLAREWQGAFDKRQGEK